MQVMLAATIDDVKQLDAKYPLFASPKLDGIRAVVKDGILYSRNMKVIPNYYITSSLPLKRMNGWDGELIVGKPEAKDCFRATTSGVMSEEGQPDFTFYIFDYIPFAPVEFQSRYHGLKQNIKALNHKHVKLVPQTKIVDNFQMYEYENMMLIKGFEGVMVRTLHGQYKHGRSTLKEGTLMKLKKFADSEAEVLGLVEQMENTNEKTIDATGKAKRSSHKAGKKGKDTLGALRVRDIHSGVEFEIGTGMDDTLRRRLWIMPHLIEKKIVKYKYFPTGSKDKPRFPVFLGIRKD